MRQSGHGSSARPSPKFCTSLVELDWRRGVDLPLRVALEPGPLASQAPGPAEAAGSPRGCQRAGCSGVGGGRRVCPEIGHGLWIAAERPGAACRTIQNITTTHTMAEMEIALLSLSAALSAMRRASSTSVTISVTTRTAETPTWKACEALAWADAAYPVCPWALLSRVAELRLGGLGPVRLGCTRGTGGAQSAPRPTGGPRTGGWVPSPSSS
jgi:hypothetical protein